MKNIIILASILAFALTSIGGPVKLTPPKEYTVEQIIGTPTEVDYRIKDDQGATYIAFQATWDRKLLRIHIVQNDHTIFSGAEGEAKSSEVTLDWTAWSKVFEKIALPIVEMRKETFVYVEDQRIYSLLGEEYGDKSHTFILKSGQHVRTIEAQKLHFFPPKDTEFKLGLKDGLLVPVVQVGTNQMVVVR